MYVLNYGDPGWDKLWTLNVIAASHVEHGGPRVTTPEATPVTVPGKPVTFTFTLPHADWESKVSPAATPTATPIHSSAAPTTIYPPLPGAVADDPGAHAVYNEGLGTHVNLTYRNSGYTWTVHWVYADAVQLIAYYSVKPPSNEPGLHISSELTFVDASGHQYRGPYLAFVPVGADGEAHFLTWVPQNQPVSSNPSSLRLQLKLSDIQVDLTGRASPTPTKQEGTVAHGTTIDVTVPFAQSRVIPVNLHGKVAGADVSLDHLVLAPSGMQAFFSHLDHDAQIMPPIIVELTTGERGYTRLRPQNAMSNLSDVVFTSPPPKIVAGDWSISLEPPEPSLKAARDPLNWLTFTFPVKPGAPAASASTPKATLTPTPAPVVGPAIFSNQDIKNSKAFNLDPGAQRVIKAGMGTFMNKSQKVGQATIDVRWVYADLNEIAVFYTVRNRAKDPTGNQTIESLSTCPPIDVRLSPKTLYSDGESGGLDTSRAQQGLVGCLLNIYTTIHQGMPQPGDSIQVELDGNLGYRDHPEPKANFNIKLTLALQPAIITLPGQTRLLAGKPVTLDQLVITPTSIAFTVSGSGESNVQNEPMPKITINGWGGTGSSYTGGGNIDTSTHSVTFALDCPPEAYPKSDTWTITIFALDARGKTITNPADAAVFTVNLPAASWVPAASATPGT